MVKVIKTNSGFYVAFKDDVQLSADEVVAYKKSTYNDVKVQVPLLFKKQFNKAAGDLTRLILKEMSATTYVYSSNVNELENIESLRKQVFETALKTNTKPDWVDYEVKSADLPVQFQNMGISIIRTPEFYFPKYDEKTQSVVCYSDRSYNCEQKVNSSRACWHHDQQYIEIFDKVYFYSPEFMDTITEVQNIVKQKKGKMPITEIWNQLTKKQQQIYEFYASQKRSYLDKKQKKYSICHECKHALNHKKIKDRKSQAIYAELNPENFGKYIEDDEKSAHLQETYLGIANYFKSGGDLSVFPRKCDWLVKKLEPLSKEKRDQLLCNHDYIVNGVINNWNKVYASAYIREGGEFQTRIIDHAYDASVTSMDNSDAEYLRRKKELFTLSIYNPRTQKYEVTDLSQHIKIMTTVRPELKKTITTANAIIKGRAQILAQHSITPTLISSLKDGSYKEPFNHQTLEDILFEKGITFNSQNDKKEPVRVQLQKTANPGRPNVISLKITNDKEDLLSFLYDMDTKEYKCLIHRKNQTYSNTKGLQYPELTRNELQKINKYINQGLQHIRNLAQKQRKNNIYE